MSVVRSYRDLIVWQESMTIAKRVYELTKSLPKAEIYGLTSQMRRCGVSIPSNIAEGHARDSSKEYLRFISIAQGSLAELETQLLLSSELGFAPLEQVQTLLQSTESLGRRLRALQKSIERKVT